MSDYSREFGRHVKSLRLARSGAKGHLTQEELATRSGLSADTIRRAEHGSFSMSIDTLRKYCKGLGLSPSTVFESFELGRTDGRRELFDLIASADEQRVTLAARVLRVLFDELDALD